MKPLRYRCVTARFSGADSSEGSTTGVAGAGVDGGGGAATTSGLAGTLAGWGVAAAAAALEAGAGVGIGADGGGGATSGDGAVAGGGAGTAGRNSAGVGGALGTGSAASAGPAISATSENAPIEAPLRPSRELTLRTTNREASRDALVEKSRRFMELRTRRAGGMLPSSRAPVKARPARPATKRAPSGACALYMYCVTPENLHRDGGEKEGM